MSIPDHPYRNLIEKVCEDNLPVPANVLEAMVWTESNFIPSAKSKSNAIGLAQIIYKWHAPTVSLVAKALGIKDTGEQLLYYPELNLTVAAKHLRWCYSECGTWEKAVRKYHSGSCNPPKDFVDGQGTSSDQHINKFRANLAEVEAEREGTSVVDKPYIIISRGHGSTNDPGNPVEKNLTDDMALATVNAFRKAGFEADYYQRDLDKDSNSEQTIGDLSTMVNGYRRILNERKDQLTVLWEEHFNGAESRFHVIVADRGNLSSAYPDGNISADSAANNTLDMEVAAAICKEADAAIPALTLYSGRLGVPGVMSEIDSGVGQQGFRLGVFGGTAIYRDTAIRLIVENGGTNDFQRYPQFAAKLAAAKVKAVQNALKLADTPPITPTPPVATFTLGSVLYEGPGKQYKEVGKRPPGTTGIITDQTIVDGVKWIDVQIVGFGSGWMPTMLPAVTIA